MFDFLSHARRKEPQPLTVEEQAEFRRMWPLLMQMLQEWEMVKSSGGCPIARRITTQD